MNPTKQPDKRTNNHSSPGLTALNFKTSPYQNFYRVILLVQFPFAQKDAIPNSLFYPPKVQFCCGDISIQFLDI